MNQKHFGDAEPPAELSGELSHLKMLVVIVSRDCTERVVELFRERHLRVHFTILAEGTCRSTLVNLLGFGSPERTIALCMAHKNRIDALLPELSAMLHLKKADCGIAFTIPLSGLLTDLPRVFLGEKITEKVNIALEKEVDEMIEGQSFNHDLVLAVVNQGNSEELLAEARTVGARGATIIHARRTGMDDAVKFLGITVQEEREIIAILIKREEKAAVMNTLNAKFGIKSDAHGVILSLPVDSAVGLME